MPVVPALSSLCGPLIKVASMPAHVDHAIDRGGATQYLSPRAVEASPVKAGLRSRLEKPVESLIIHRIRQGAGHADEQVSVATTCLE